MRVLFLYSYCLIGLILLSACGSKPANESEAVNNSSDSTFAKRAMIEENFIGYDSFRYFTNVNWLGLTGQKAMAGEQLAYPFVQYAYRKDYLDLYFHFNSRKRIQWRILNSAYGKMLHVKRYVKGGTNDMVHYYILFRENETVQIESNQEPLSDVMHCRTITRYISTKNGGMKEDYFSPSYGYRDIAVKDATTFNFPALGASFERYTLRLLQFDTTDHLYETYQYSKDNSDNKVTENNQSTRLSPHRFSSFAFYFAHLFDYQLFEIALK